MKRRQLIHNLQSSKERRGGLRRNPTRAESYLWQSLRRSQLDGKKFRRQHGIGPYIVDFYCPECRVIVELDGAGHFGLLGAERDEARTRFLGYRPESYKLFVFVLSAVMAGIGGALYVPQVGIINPSEFSPVNSIEAVIWVAVGGRGTLVGAILGAGLVNFGKTWFTGALPELWLYALGALFIVVTLFLPRGLMGLFVPRARPARSGSEPEPTVGPAREVTG